MKKILIFLLFCNAVIAQKPLESNQFEGYIIKKNGDRLEGIVEISDVEKPWSYQEKIKFFDKELLTKDKIKDKEKKDCKPGDVVEYGFGTKRFVLISYTGNNVSDANQMSQTLGAFKNLTSNKYFAEVYREGKVSVYKYYNSPPEAYVTSGADQAANMKAFIEDCKRNFDILIERDGEKAKQFDEVNVKKFFKDCELVVNKYKDGQYIKKPVKGIKSAINSAMLRGDALANAAMEIINDYEQNCAK